MVESKCAEAVLETYSGGASQALPGVGAGAAVHVRRLCG